MKPGDFGVTIFRGRRPMPAPCADCPFKLAAEGRDYLAPGRLDAIRFAASMGQAFWCHKTAYARGVPREPDGSAPPWHPAFRQCAGANAYARELARELGLEPAVIGDPFA